MGTFSTVIFDVEKHNDGSAYSTATGEFTAPVNGVYQFNIALTFRVFTFPGTGGSPSTQIEAELAIYGGADALMNPEPNFFILGAKSYGRDSRFLLKVGFEQVRDVVSALTATRTTRDRAAQTAAR